ncbi:MAG: hypothetical protein PHO94_06515 [Petrimonas sp.]|nr:hypothetical protein [Petrimonas sp.]
MNDLASTLHQMYTNAPKGEKVAMIHLFGIKYAEQIQEGAFSKEEIATRAKIPDTYATEISKGVKLSKYVTIK